MSGKLNITKYTFQDLFLALMLLTMDNVNMTVIRSVINDNVDCTISAVFKPSSCLSLASIYTGLCLVLQHT